MSHASEKIAQAAAEVASSTAAKATYFGGTLSAVGGLALSSEFIALVGLALAILGWITQLFFSIRRDRREAEHHRLEIETMRERRERRRSEHGTSDQ